MKPSAPTPASIKAEGWGSGTAATAWVGRIAEIVLGPPAELAKVAPTVNTSARGVRGDRLVQLDDLARVECEHDARPTQARCDLVERHLGPPGFGSSDLRT